MNNTARLMGLGFGTWVSILETKNRALQPHFYIVAIMEPDGE